MKIISDWFQRFFNDPQAVILTVVLVLGTSVVLVMGQDLAPVLASMVIAYLLEGVVQQLQHHVRLPRWLAVVIVFVLFLAFLLFLLFGLLPLASRQLTQFIQQLPNMIVRGQQLLLSLPALYPEFITEAQVLEVINAIRAEIANLGQRVLSWSLAAGMGFITIAIYLVLAPLLVFFFLKDKELILNWLHGFFPRDHTLAQQVWREVDRQMGNYVRGKFLEIVVVWVATYAAFAYLGLQFAMLLALMVGLSVIVPYIGAVVVTVPVALVAFFQWGWGPDFLWLLGVYLIIQGLDGNVLVPLLFSEVVDLHPIAIITAVLVFGGLWGFWGIFFAIPLATVVQSILKAWPRQTVVAVD
ncbi:MAG TPA: AI-2E family transporter [Candidatus Competibacteraceae bacterium]|nr:AI-2E family transporter [Candidatus Competibacteraceae bacterium]HRZ06723.1 AI-2E family transporter [Candidatus Competibacteraceae bacterium]HSA45226.1 AI-2E family transporter [Candidatus Competibacteraceae bacterium]